MEQAVIVGGNGSGLPRFRFTMGFILHLGTTLFAIVTAVVTMQYKVESATKELTELKRVVETQEELIHMLSLDSVRTQQDLKDFRLQYERDMSRYVRDGVRVP